MKTKPQFVAISLILHYSQFDKVEVTLHYLLCKATKGTHAVCETGVSLCKHLVCEQDGHLCH